MTAGAIDIPAPPAPAAPSPTVALPPYVPVVLCRCGHEKDAHEHYRPGYDCAVCGSVRCRSFRRRTGRGPRRSFRR